MKLISWSLILLCVILLSGTVHAARPNILFIMTDDHATTAFGAYGKRLAKLNPTPTLDRLAENGVLFRNAFVGNSICTPSRATALTGQYSQSNGVLDLAGTLPAEKQYLPTEMKKLGYQTAIIGKWHLKAEPAAFDYYKVMIAAGQQGTYFDPEFIEKGMEWHSYLNKGDTFKTAKHEGHSSDVITDLTINWLKKKRNKKKPFFLMHHYKAPHDDFEYAPRYEDYLADLDIPAPISLFAQPFWGSVGTRGHNGGLERIIGSSISRRHNTRNYVNQYGIDPALPDDAATWLAYQKYVKKYLRCVKGVDDNLARLFAYLKDAGLWDNTIIIYTSDQGMMLGEHDMMDKRWMYDESIHIPLVVRLPKNQYAGTESKQFINNADFAPTILELAGGSVPEYMQGRSFKGIIEGKTDKGREDSLYYRYWMHMIHHDIPAHFGIRTDRYKLIFFYGYHYEEDIMGTKSFEWWDHSNMVFQTPAAWEFYDLHRDPEETVNRYDDPEYSEIVTDLKTRLLKRREQLDETDANFPHLDAIIQKHWDSCN